MGYARVRSQALLGVTGEMVVVEADITPGLPRLVVSGLPDTALSESRDRVRAAVINSGERWPQQRLTVNLLPAHLPKHGSGFDLPVAVAILMAAGAIHPEALSGMVLLGELGLDGTVRPVRGVLPATAAAARSGAKAMIVPAENASEAGAVPGITVLAVETLGQLVSFARGTRALSRAPESPAPIVQTVADLADVVGQDRGRRAVTLAAAGGHHLALIGPPGSGKTMLAQRLPGLLPRLDDRAARETTAVHSIAGTLSPGGALVRVPPLQAPHHTASEAAVVGGGPGLARPGAVSLAHNGVLFLDEAAEFRHSVLNALREPLESGEVRLRRSGGETVYPARAQLVLAANPCPCAAAGGARGCRCTSQARRRYVNRLSGPLMDRVDLRVTLRPVRSAALLGAAGVGETTRSIARQVVSARAAAAERWSDQAPMVLNGTVPGTVVRVSCHHLPRAVLRIPSRELDRGRLSARGYDRVIRVAWTIADLEGHGVPEVGDMAEAMDLRLGPLS